MEENNFGPKFAAPDDINSPQEAFVSWDESKIPDDLEQFKQYLSSIHRAGNFKLKGLDVSKIDEGDYDFWRNNLVILMKYFSLFRLSIRKGEAISKELREEVRRVAERLRGEHSQRLIHIYKFKTTPEYDFMGQTISHIGLLESVMDEEDVSVIRDELDAYLGFICDATSLNEVALFSLVKKD